MVNRVNVVNVSALRVEVAAQEQVLRRAEAAVEWIVEVCGDLRHHFIGEAVNHRHDLVIAFAFRLMIDINVSHTRRDPRMMGLRGGYFDHLDDGVFLLRIDDDYYAIILHGDIELAACEVR